MIKRLIRRARRPLLLAAAGWAASAALKRLDRRRYPTLNIDTGKVEPEFAQWLQQPPVRADGPEVPLPGQPVNAEHARQQEEFAAYLARRSRLAYEWEERRKRLLEATGVPEDELREFRRVHGADTPEEN